MSNAPATRLSLLVRLRNARDDGAWSQFVEIYAPLAYGFARRHGLQDADAANLTQDVLQAVSGGIRRLDYDPRRGTFRGWLFTVVRNKLRNFLAAQDRPGRGAGDSDAQQRLQDLPAREEDENAWWDQRIRATCFVLGRRAGPWGLPEIDLAGLLANGGRGQDRPGGGPIAGDECCRRLPRQGQGDGPAQGNHPPDTRRIRIGGRCGPAEIGGSHGLQRFLSAPGGGRRRGGPLFHHLRPLVPR